MVAKKIEVETTHEHYNEVSKTDPSTRNPVQELSVREASSDLAERVKVSIFFNSNNKFVILF